MLELVVLIKPCLHALKFVYCSSNDYEEEISVNESNKSNTNFLDDLFNMLYGKSNHNDEVKDEGVKDGQQHQDNSGGLKERQDSDQSLQSHRESEQYDMIKMAVEDSRRDRSHNSFTDLARLGKTLCLKVKGNDCRKRRG